jgi:ppGpp synthetase/RelA/SpoT-type nucleotidyltranferase
MKMKMECRFSASCGLPASDRNRRRRRQRPASTATTTCGSTAWVAKVSVLILAVNGPWVLAFAPATVSTSRGSLLATTETLSEHTHTLEETTADNVCLERLLRTLQEEEETSARCGAPLPPWMQRYHDPTEQTEDHASLPLQQLQGLEGILVSNGFSSDDIHEILQTIMFYTTTSSATPTANIPADFHDASLLLGVIDFVKLILDEQCHFENAIQDEPSSLRRMHQDVFASKPIILAGIVHFAECMAARQGGVYDWLKGSSVQQNSRKQSPKLPTRSDNKRRLGNATLTLSSPRGQAQRIPRQQGLSPTVLKIAASAAAIKRAEVLASTILGVGTTRRLTKEEAESLQGLLLSSMEDWRALALRCIASLFRLQGILEQASHVHHDEQAAKENASFEPLFQGLRSPEVVHTAQEAILVYGTLAQRLGMHALKAKIEERAFRILYQRQYRAVSSVYQQNRGAMAAIKSYLSTQMDFLLRSDASLMAHIDELHISSRVKEPYSFWKKLLKSQAKRKRLGYKLAGASASATKGKTASNLSFTQVQDGIALRVILKAKKESPDEPEETTRAREKLLCYYVQHLIRRHFPGDQDRVKDYIQYPKRNGYQSLHYTASLADSTGQQFPFEVQVRSEEMHRVAEYGVAAHWDYKLASSSSTSNGIDRKAMFAIDAAAEAVVESEEPIDKSTDTTPLEDIPIKTIEELDAIPQPLSFEKVIMEPSMVYHPQALIRTEGNIERVSTKQMSPPKDKNQVEYIDALVTARDTLVEERVYVFVAGAASLTMEQGQLVILDAGSTIHDALAYVRKATPEVFRMQEAVLEGGRSVSGSPAAAESRPSEPRVWRNGRLAQPDDVIRNGDVLLLEL